MTYRQSPPKGEQAAKGIVLMFHGLHMHANCGAHVAKVLAEKNLIVLSFD